MVEERPIALNKTTAPAGRKPPVAAGMTPKEVLGVLRRHVLLIVALTISGLLIGSASWYLLREYSPKYAARTYMEVLPPVDVDPTVIEPTVVRKEIRYGYRLTIASLIKQQSSLQRLLGSDEVKNTKWFRSKGNERKRVKDLERNFEALAYRDGDFVEISMTCSGEDADRESALIVNEMLDQFVGQQGVTKRTEIEGKLTQLNDRFNIVQRELDRANVELDAVRRDKNIYDLDMPAGYEYRHTITIRLNNLELEQSNLLLTISQLRAVVANYVEQAQGAYSDQVEILIQNDPIMLSLAQQLAFQEADRQGRLTGLGLNHRTVRQQQDTMNKITTEIEKRRKEIAERTRQANLENAQDSLLVLQQRYIELEKLRQEAEDEKRDLDMARIQYQERVARRDERIIMLDSIKQQIEKLNIIHDDPETPKVRKTGDAPVPLDMVMSRQWHVWCPSGAVLGFLLSVGLAFLIELANDLVRTPRDVGRYLHVPLLGVIPDAAEDNQVRGVELCHVVRQAPYSIISESYRRCRTNLKLSTPAESLKTVLVGSGMAGDGRTSVAANLAATFVAENKKVLLIDANFRQPSLHTLFPKSAGEDMGIESFDFGLSSVLTKQCGYSDAVRSSGIEGLDIIDSGPVPSNPAELLGSTRMEELLKEQRNNYDYIIIDTPPVLLVSDAKVFAKLVDATLLVFNAAATRRGAALRTIREMRQVGATVVGCVLFGVRSMKGGYFQEQFKSYRKYQKVQLAAAGTA